MKIIVDMFNQHSGDLEELKRMALTAWQCGADIVKIQLLNSKKIWGDDSRKYLEMTENAFYSFTMFCVNYKIPWAATPFCEEHLKWLGIRPWIYKVASWTTKNDPLFAAKVIELAQKTATPCLVSTGMNAVNEFPFGKADGLHYLYCVSEYPADSNTVMQNMPTKFSQYTEDGNPWYSGYSDHAMGIRCAETAQFRGALFLEKHFTFDTQRKCATEKAHCCSFDFASLRKFKNMEMQRRCVG